MVFGHNTNLKLGNVTFHIQTEDRGEPHALIDTTVYHHGRVMHRRTVNYSDLLPMNEDREQALRLRLDEQHRTVIEEIRSGALPLSLADAAAPQAAADSGNAIPAEPGKLVLELTNSKSWLSGKQARLQVLVRDGAGGAVGGANVHVEVEGGEGGGPYEASTSAQGIALIEFELPKITNPEASIVISAEKGTAQGHLRFALRAKPRMVTR